MAPHGPWPRRAALLAGALAVYTAGVLGLERLMIFPRYVTSADPNAGTGVEGLERLWLDTDAGRVEAWFLPGRGVGVAAPGPLVVFAHGNAELIEDWPALLSPYRERGYSVLLPEYRGYGRSGGRPSERAIVADFAAFYDRVVARADVDDKRVVLHGRSLGGGVVVALARRRAARALVLQSTFTSIAGMARRFLVPRFLLLDRFDNLEGVRELDVPVLIAHGRRDSLVPFAHAEALARAARDARLIAYDADHNDCPPSWSVFFRDVQSFLAEQGMP